MSKLSSHLRLCSLSVSICTLLAPRLGQADDVQSMIHTESSDECRPSTSTSPPPPPPPPAKDTGDSPPPPPPSPPPKPPLAKSASRTLPPAATSQIELSQSATLQPLNIALTKSERALATHQKRGSGLAIGAGLSIATSLGLGIIALRGVDKRCIQALEGQPEAITSTSLDPCIAGEPALIAAGVGSGLMLLASGGLAAGGAWELGLAHEPPARRSRRMRLGLGSVLLPLGLSAVLTSVFAFRVTLECDSVQCLRGSRINDLIVRTLGGTAATGGAALLGSLGPRKRRPGYARLAPQLRRESVGLALVGRF